MIHVRNRIRISRLEPTPVRDVAPYDVRSGDGGIATFESEGEGVVC